MGDMKLDGMTYREALVHLLVMGGAPEDEAKAMVDSEGPSASIRWDACSEVARLISDKSNRTGRRLSHLAIPRDLYDRLRMESARQSATLKLVRFPLHPTYVNFDGTEVFPQDG